MFLDSYLGITKEPEDKMKRTAVTVVELFLIYQGWQVYKTNRDKKAAEAAVKIALDPKYQLPPATWSLPGGQSTTTQSTNYASLANEFKYYYGTYITDRDGLSKTLEKTPPQYFNAVAQQYATLDGRNLRNDLDGVLNGTIWQGGWDLYKTQIT